MSGSAFPGLVGWVLGGPGGDGDSTVYGLCVGWEDGYLVLATGSGNLTRISSTHAGLKVIGKGRIACEGDDEEDEDALPQGAKERAVA